MGLSAVHIGELVAELRALVLACEVRDVQPRPPRDLLLVLAGPSGATRRLCLSADPEAARIHLWTRPLKRHEGPSDPFFARVAQVLVGSELAEFEQVRGDRVVRLSFRRDGRPAAALVGELTGRHANLVLLDGGLRVDALLVPPAKGTPAAQRLTAGAVYALPPGQRAPAPSGPSIAEAFPAPQESAGEAPLSARVEAALAFTAETRFVEEARRELERRLERRLASARALVAGLEERRRTAGECERVRHDGELLLAHLASIPRGADGVELPDAFTADAPARRIELDPGLSPRRNAERLFARYRKLKRTAERLPEEMARAADDVVRVRSLLARITDEAPEALEAEAIALGVLKEPAPPPEKPGKPAPRRPYKTFRALHGSEIRVGRTAEDNDRLTFRESRGNDLWLHTADSPGSHVVLRLAPGAEPDPEEVLDAAHLAVHYSPLRGRGQADVHIARRKEVHKPRKAKPGLVTLSGGKVLRLRVEPARLARLLDARRTPGDADP